MAGQPSQPTSGQGLVMLSVVRAASGQALLGPVEMPESTPVADVLRQVLDASLGAEAQRFVEPTLLHGAEQLRPEEVLADIAGEHGGLPLQLSCVFCGRDAVEISIGEVSGLSRPYPEVRSIILTAAAEFVELGCLADKLPRLEELQIKFQGSFFYKQHADYWAPLKELSALRRLRFFNHHSHRHNGEIDADSLFDALLAWGGDGPQLSSFKIEGAMSLSLRKYGSFVESNHCLLPELEEFAVHYWFANPPLVNTETLQRITKRYQKLRVLEVGSCCHSVRDSAFKYFMDNDEGVRAGLQLEDLFLTCITQVDGAGWLELENVQKNLPKLKKFSIGGGRVFCTCGEHSCGRAAHRIRRLQEEKGLEFKHSAPHW